MAATHYKIANWGDPVGEGVSDSQYINVTGIAKTNSPAEPNIVANEYICARLAAAVGLPVPPGFLVKKDDEPWFVSMDFNLAGDVLPPIIPQILLARKPELCAGIVLFDAWILNPDRHARNLAHDTTTDAVIIFDHSRALMPTDLPQRQYAEAMVDKPAIGAHCLGTILKDASTFKYWHQRILAVAEHQITDALNDAAEVGLEPGNVHFFRQYLLDRRQRLPKIVANNPGAFPSLTLGTLPWTP
ncbi:MAG: hypothetical protein JNJ91_10240 [Flavobacteriales bacterium]|nr:hypothetical protein [Flavobacteriales bacterium]